MLRTLHLIALTVAFIGVGFSFPCIAEVTKLCDGYRKALSEPEDFHRVSAVKDLPENVVTLIADENGKLANPGEEWQLTDVVTDDHLPRKRLTWAATNGDVYVVHYELGGRGHSYHMMITGINNGKVETSCLWFGVSDKVLKNFNEFLNALKNNEIDDRRNYAH